MTDKKNWQDVKKSIKEIRNMGELSKSKTVSIVMPESWYLEIKAIAIKKRQSINKVICEVLRKKFKLKEKKRPHGRPQKYLKIKIQDIK